MYLLHVEISSIGKMAALQVRSSEKIPLAIWGLAGRVILLHLKFGNVLSATYY